MVTNEEAEGVYMLNIKEDFPKRPYETADMEGRSGLGTEREEFTGEERIVHKAHYNILIFKVL